MGTMARDVTWRCGGLRKKRDRRVPFWQMLAPPWSGNSSLQPLYTYTFVLSILPPGPRPATNSSPVISPPTITPNTTVRCAIFTGSRSAQVSRVHHQSLTHSHTVENTAAVPTAAPMSFVPPHPTRTSPSSIPTYVSPSAVSRPASVPAPFSAPNSTL